MQLLGRWFNKCRHRWLAPLQLGADSAHGNSRRNSGWCCPLSLAGRVLQSAQQRSRSIRVRLTAALVALARFFFFFFFLTSRFQARNGAERPQLNICARLISAFACLCCCCCAGCCCSSFTVGYCPSSQDYRGLPPSGSPRRRWKAREIGSVNRCVPARGIRCRSKRSRAPPSPLKASGN